MDLFQSWWRIAQKEAADKENQANAMTVSTVNTQNQPSNRVALLRQVTPEHLIFFTNYESQKGQDLKTNPKVCLHFFWTHLTLQIQIIGSAEKTSREISENYWNSRARESQISQALSLQSQPFPLDKSLEKVAEEYSLSHPNSIPCPSDWGGYQVTPQQWEFWIGRPNRLHHRVKFSKNNSSSWASQQLYP